MGAVLGLILPLRLVVAVVIHVIWRELLALPSLLVARIPPMHAAQLFLGNITVILLPVCCTGMCASSYCVIHARRITIGRCLQWHRHPVCFVYPTVTRRA